MRSIDPAKFRTFLAAVEDGEPIDSALREAYAMSAGTMWRRFTAEGANRGSIVSEIERDDMSGPRMTFTLDGIGSRTADRRCLPRKDDEEQEKNESRPFA